jgi:hypothetical protein
MEENPGVGKCEMNVLVTGANGFIGRKAIGDVRSERS